MRRAGVDIGSRTIAVVVLENGQIIFSKVVDTGYQPNETAAALLAPFAAPVVATGYGRHAARASFAREIITEIKAHALGAVHLFPEARTILDIGGQDTKAILLSPQKTVVDFVMNDKCSAGTGKFLEVMAAALGYDIAEIGPAALTGQPGLKISNMCTVFAESEAISLLHRGTPRQDIALALHRSVAERAAALLKKIGFTPPLVFTGGVAQNPCLVQLLAEMLETTIYVPPAPQIVGALGAALHCAALE